MTENKGQTIFLSVIGIATLLVAIIGATFAYFTTSMGGTQGTVKATTAKIGAASFTAQSVVLQLYYLDGQVKLKLLQLH